MRFRRLTTYRVEPVKEETSNGCISVFHDNAFTKYWRPFMCWQYGMTLAVDLVVMPIVSLVFFKTIWKPITFDQNAVTYHMAMGAIAGVTSWTRTQEKTAAMQAGPPPPGPPINTPMDQFRKTPP